MGTVQVAPLDATLGAELSNVSLKDLDDASWRVVEDAFNTYGVIVAHDQYLSLDEQLAFGARFGELCRNDASRMPMRPDGETPDGGFFAPVVGNVDKDGKHHTDAEDPYIRSGIGNNEWHSDSSFQHLGAIASILAGVEVPEEDGHTEFADMRAAYDALPAETTERLAGLRAWHSVVYSRVTLGALDRDLPEDLTTLPGAEHSMVRRHPVTGRPSLVIGSHLAHIYGMDDAEAHRWVQDLIDQACQPPRVYSHKWREGDVVAWDNRSVLHRGRTYDYSQRRRLQHVRVAGEVEF
ncbi:MAG: TauD/TfdA family dioxygenase [Acidimicrobiaceae bacterium]|nr:TauD/TfdA family dioxygenase [Acidimicrobiaceae bacterium]